MKKVKYLDGKCLEQDVEEDEIVGITLWHAVGPQLVVLAITVHAVCIRSAPGGAWLHDAS